MRYLVAEYTRRSRGWAIIVDDKDPARAQYEGQEFVDVVDVGSRGLEPHPRIAILRGDTKFGRDVEPDEAARWCWSMKAAHLPTLFVLDEAKHGQIVTYGTWMSGVEWVPRTLEKGRGIGIGVLWGAQFPQQIPIDFLELTQIVLVFKSSGLAIAKLVERKLCTNGVELVIPTLKGYPDDPATRGEFVLLQRGTVWNGRIYKFSA